MHIHIESRRVQVSRRFVDSVRTAVRECLEPLSTAIAGASVRLSDRNGRRGGSDKQCEIVVSLRDGCRIACDDRRANLKVAVGRAMSRLEGAVRRRVRELASLRIKIGVQDS